MEWTGDFLALPSPVPPVVEIACLALFMAFTFVAAALSLPRALALRGEAVRNWGDCCGMGAHKEDPPPDAATAAATSTSASSASCTDSMPTRKREGQESTPSSCLRASTPLEMTIDALKSSFARKREGGSKICCHSCMKKGRRVRTVLMCQQALPVRLVEGKQS